MSKEQYSWNQWAQDGIIGKTLSSFSTHTSKKNASLDSINSLKDSRVLKKVFVDIVESRESSKFLNIHLNEEYNSLDFEKKIDYLSKVSGNISSSIFKDPIIVDTLGSIEAMKIIQKLNGEKGSNRYIISNCSSLEDILILFALIRMTSPLLPC